jgi:hypothetical protein
MRFIDMPRVVALLIAFVIIFVAVADANAYLYFVIPVLALDVGLTLANANALSNKDPNIITGIAGLTMGSMITYSGVLSLMEIEETWHFGVTAILGAIGISSVISGWKVIKASRRREETARHQRNARFIPLVSRTDGKRLQFGFSVEFSF